VSGGDAQAGTPLHADLLVLGGGPGGYTAAFRAADLGLDVVLVERYETLGGICLNVGCIPSKALLHVAKVITEAEGASELGLSFAAPEIDLDAVRAWKDGVVQRLTGGLAVMADRRGVTVVRGEGHLTGPHSVDVEGRTITFEQAILASGSHPVRLPGIPHEDPRVIGSTGALALKEIPARLLVIGGGIVGLELACVYDALGSEVTVVELADQLIPGGDPDLIAPLHRRIAGRYAAIHLSTRIASLEADPEGLHATFEQDGSTTGRSPIEPASFDAALVAVGRRPNSEGLGLEHAGVVCDELGFVTVDSQLRTSAAHIYAVGDLVGPPMLAHKAIHEGRVAAEVAAGGDVELDVRGIPSVAYTDPEVAWVGLTEVQAKETGRAYRRVSAPWSASGRALASSASNGLTKLLIDPGSNRLLGAGIVGAGAGELIAEPGLALELGVDTEDIALAVHAHPTLAETIALAAEVAEGTATDLPPTRSPARLA
jgi:dihydrolipoamide dehydrogenase